jgi:hypothetical protein
MNARLLIDAVVRQTTVLIAQLSTTAGIRAPLSHVANQVFLDLVAELEGEGLGRKVIADMFGLALRSYQQKVQRLSESATDRGTTLWEAVYRFLQEREVVTRAEVFERFEGDDGATVRGVLNDLVETGLVFKTGRGDDTIYRVTSQEDVDRVTKRERASSDGAVVWVTVYRHGPLTETALGERLGLDTQVLRPLVERLAREGRVTRELVQGEPVYRAETCFIPLEQAGGWEAAVLDHYGAVVGTVCARLRTLSGGPAEEPVGGSTFSFDVWPGHPHRERVRSLLEKTRAEIANLWSDVHAHNTHAGKPDNHERVTFYFGQNVRNESSDELPPEPTPPS